MNSIKAKIENINNLEELHLIKAMSSKIPFNIVTLEIDKKIEQGINVNLCFKETEVILCKNKEPALSIENRIKCNIVDIRKGEILSYVKMISKCGVINSLILTKYINKLNLKITDNVSAMVKANSISIEEVL